MLDKIKTYIAKRKLGKQKEKELKKEWQATLSVACLFCGDRDRSSKTISSMDQTLLLRLFEVYRELQDFFDSNDPYFIEEEAHLYNLIDHWNQALGPNFFKIDQGYLTFCTDMLDVKKDMIYLENIERVNNVT